MTLNYILTPPNKCLRYDVTFALANDSFDLFPDSLTQI